VRDSGQTADVAVREAGADDSRAAGVTSQVGGVPAAGVGAVSYRGARRMEMEANLRPLRYLEVGWGLGLGDGFTDCAATSSYACSCRGKTVVGERDLLGERGRYGWMT
jgi:hypothetical protein